MTIHSISSPGHGEHNEDLIAVFNQEGLTDIVIIDGGSSVADEDYLDVDAGDVVWFVRQFAAALEHTISAERSQEESVRLALERVRVTFDAMPRRAEIPLYAWPIAAMTWARIRKERGETTLDAYCLGDCKLFVRLADQRVLDLDPFVNGQEHVLREQIVLLSKEGITDPATRRERLMPMLRTRREFQNSTAAPISLCLQPQGPFDARKNSVQLDPGAMLLLMTDGFYRLVDTYGLYTNEQLADACAGRGLAALVHELREHESRRAGALVVKSADDASAVTWVHDHGA
jgi:hypothetical protein